MNHSQLYKNSCTVYTITPLLLSITGLVYVPSMSTSLMDVIGEISVFTASCGLSGAQGRRASAYLDGLGGICERPSGGAEQQAAESNWSSLPDFGMKITCSDVTRIVAILRLSVAILRLSVAILRLSVILYRKKLSLIHGPNAYNKNAKVSNK